MTTVCVVFLFINMSIEFHLFIAKEKSGGFIQSCFLNAQFTPLQSIKEIACAQRV